MRALRLACVGAGIAALLVAVCLSVLAWPVPPRTMATVARALARGVTGTACPLVHGVTQSVVPVAEAQQELEFKPVPRESVTRFERLRVERKRRASDADTGDVRESLPPSPPESPRPPRGEKRSGSVMRIGSDIHVGPGEVIEGDLSSLSGDIVIEGHVQGDVVAMRGDVDLKSTAHVDGDVVCLGGTITEEPGARVDGQRVTASGPVSHWVNDESHEERSREDGEGLPSALVWLLILMLLGWVYARFAPGRTAAAVETLRHQPGMSLAIGSLIWALIIPSIVALVLVVALLCITILGIPLALAALVGYTLLLAVLATWGFVVAATVAGAGLATRPSAVAAATMPAPPVVPGATTAPAAAPMPAAVRHEPSLVRTTLMGVIALLGGAVLGQLLHVLAHGGPLRGLGTLIRVLSIIASFLGMTVGAGALVRAEFVSGRLTQLWNRRRMFGGPASSPAPAGSPAMAVATPAPGGVSSGPPVMPPGPPEAAPPASS